MRIAGVEPTQPAWKAGNLPLIYIRGNGVSNLLKTEGPLGLGEKLAW